MKFQTFISGFLTFVLWQVKAAEFEEDANVGIFKLEGKVTPPDDEMNGWFTNTRILVNGGDYLGFIRDDGSFVVSNLPSGSYVVEVSSPDLMYEAARVEITTKGKIRARKLNFVQASSVVQLPYPLKFKTKGRFKYFQSREQWRVTDFLFSPMVLMMVLPLLLIMVMPKLMNAADPDTQREMQQSLQGSNFDVPFDLSETMTSFFGGAKKQPATQKAIKSSKKRQ